MDKNEMHEVEQVTRVPDWRDIVRTKVRCTCGKEYSGWDSWQTVQRMDRHIAKESA